jgi:hypothetical protein
MRLLRKPGAGQGVRGDRHGRVDDLAAMQYARASFLLFARGSRSALTFSTGCGAELPPSWRQDLGVATSGAHRRVVWRRTFVGGMVVVSRRLTCR